MASSSNAHGSRKKKSSGVNKGKNDSLAVAKKSTSPVASDGRSSPDLTCSICLGQHENKCFTNNCLHEFCFKCLLEWSKVKAECPLCKQPFSSIIHNVRSNQEYDEHQVPIMEPQEPDLSGFDLVFPGRRFQYRTTMTADRRQALALERRNMEILRQFSEDGILPNAQRPRMSRITSGMSRITGTSSFRRRTYAKDLWVQPLSDITGRYRETTPEFFQLNPAMTHRLVPWLNRELNVLLTNQDHRSYVLDMIIRLITQHHILSRHFRDALQQYTVENTEHFIHEFYQFARSPYDMYGFDENAQYDRRERQFNFEEVAVESSESSEDEVSTRFTAIRSRSNRVAPVDIPLPPSPQPGPSGLGRSSMATLSDDGQSYSIRATASSSGPSLRPSDEDEEGYVEIVTVVKPSPPEIITLSDSGSSDNNDDRSQTDPSEATSTSSRGKALKRRRDPSPPVRSSSHKDKKLKSKKMKKKRSKSDGSSSSSRLELDRREPSPLPWRSERPHRTCQETAPHHQQLRYWEMDPEEIRQLHKQSRAFESPDGSNNSNNHRGKRSAKRSGRKK